ncbi:MAG: FG-GAP repeat protein [Proteobacteria bacterium]|nr:FG-GAP repeat protein [Pseudomonadota bacterium]
MFIALVYPPSTAANANNQASAPAPPHSQSKGRLVSALPTGALKYSVGFQYIDFAWSATSDTDHYQIQVSRGGADYTTILGAENITGTSFRAQIRFWDIDGADTQYRLLACGERRKKCTVHGRVVIKSGAAYKAVGRIRSAAVNNAVSEALDVLLMFKSDPRDTGRTQFDGPSRLVHLLQSQHYGADLPESAPLAFSTDGTVAVRKEAMNSPMTSLRELTDDEDIFFFHRQDESWARLPMAEPEQTGLHNPGAPIQYARIRAARMNATGDTLAIGYPGHSPKQLPYVYDMGLLQSEEGSVAVYAREDDQWSRQVVLAAPHAEPQDRFGHSIALSADGDTLAVGAPGQDSGSGGVHTEFRDDNSEWNAGSVYVYTRTDGRWQKHSLIKPENPQAYDHFGSTLSLSADGKMLAVGTNLTKGARVRSFVNKYLAPDKKIATDPREIGTVYIYSLADGRWSPHSTLRPENGASGDLFGSAISFNHDGSVLAVGAKGKSVTAEVKTTAVKNNADDRPRKKPTTVKGTGAVYLFIRDDIRWHQQAFVQQPMPRMLGYFGTEVAISGDGDTLIIRASGENPDAGTLATDLVPSDTTNFIQSVYYMY